MQPVKMVALQVIRARLLQPVAANLLYVSEKENGVSSKLTSQPLTLPEQFEVMTGLLTWTILPLTEICNTSRLMLLIKGLRGLKESLQVTAKLSAMEQLGPIPKG